MTRKFFMKKTSFVTLLQRTDLFGGGVKWCKLVAVPNKYIRFWKFRACSTVRWKNFMKWTVSTKIHCYWLYIRMTIALRSIKSWQIPHKFTINQTDLMAWCYNEDMAISTTIACENKRKLSCRRFIRYILSTFPLCFQCKYTNFQKYF